MDAEVNPGTSAGRGPMRSLEGASHWCSGRAAQRVGWGQPLKSAGQQSSSWSVEWHRDDLRRMSVLRLPGSPASEAAASWEGQLVLFQALCQDQGGPCRCRCHESCFLLPWQSWPFQMCSQTLWVTLLCGQYLIPSHL